MVIAQITDTHIRRKGRPLYGVIDTAKHLRRCIEHVNRLEPRPDVVLATGDLTDGGKPKEYRRLRKLLDEVAAPVLVIPGNHDDREGLRAEFSDYPHVAATGRYFQYVVDDYPVRLIALDSTEPGRPGGFLDDARLDWLAARLAERRDRPTLVFMHHPPFQTGIRAMDALGFIGVERFGEIIERCGHVERIVAGHIHRAMQVGWKGTIASVAPSTAYQLVLAQRSQSRLGFSLEPPGFALHVWTGETILTHTIVVDPKKIKR